MLTAVHGKTKCPGHGGLSTGPRTADGKARIAAAKTIHSRETRIKRLQRSQISFELRLIEEQMFSEGMIQGPRTRGRKPTLWAQKKTFTQISQECYESQPQENTPSVHF